MFTRAAGVQAMVVHHKLPLHHTPPHPEVHLQSGASPLLLLVPTLGCFPMLAPLLPLPHLVEALSAQLLQQLTCPQLLSLSVAQTPLQVSGGKLLCLQ